MEISKRVENLQKEWQAAKYKEEEDRSNLLKSLQLKAQRHE
jgi:hypothetical protein